MVDVPVIIQLGFQLFDIATGGVRTVQPVQKNADSPGAVHGKVVDTPVDASTTGAMV